MIKMIQESIKATLNTLSRLTIKIHLKNIKNKNLHVNKINQFTNQ